MTDGQGLLVDAGISTMRVWVAFLLAAVMAVPIGILMSSYRVVGAALEPIVDFIRYLPVPALVPLSIIWFGVGEDDQDLPPLARHVLPARPPRRRRHAPRARTNMSRSPIRSAPGSARRCTDVAFRAMLPSLVDNLRITLGWCWTYLIIAEIVAADSGLGFVIWTARRYMKTPEVMAGVVIDRHYRASSPTSSCASCIARLFRYL